MTAVSPIYEDDVYAVSKTLCRAALERMADCAGVIIDHVITSERIFKELLQTFSNCNFFMIRVTCPLPELQRREARRGDRFIGSAEASAQYLYPQGTYDWTVDTGAWTAEQCTGQIMDALKNSTEIL